MCDTADGRDDAIVGIIDISGRFPMGRSSFGPWGGGHCGGPVGVVHWSVVGGCGGGG